MKDYFKFLEELTVGDEVLLSDTGDRIFKITGVSQGKIAICTGYIYDQESGTQITKRKDCFSALLELTQENKDRIKADNLRRTAKAQQEQKENLIRNEYDELTGIAYRANKPSLENQIKIIEFIKTLGG